MNFPSFGDADALTAAGRACAAALAGHGGRVFSECYHPLRPRPVIMVMAVPHLVADDPVDAAYVLLLLNVLFAAGAVAALFGALSVDRVLRERFLIGASVMTLLPNVVSLLPVALGDLPALFAYLMAVREGARVVARLPGEPSSARSYALCGLWLAGAVLMKQTYLLHGAMFVALVLLLDPQPRSERDRAVYLHSGHFWLFEPEPLRAFSYPSRGQAIEAVFHTLPQEGAYTVKAAAPLGFASLVVMRLFRGLFGFEWSVYHGRAFRDEWWTIGRWDLPLAWLLVALYAGFVAVALWRGTPSLRALTAAGAGVATVTAVMGHTELRYYALPRTALWLTLVCGAASVASRRRGALPDPRTN